NTGGEPPAWMLRKGSAGGNTGADHIQIVGAAIAALPPGGRRDLMGAVGGAGVSHKLVGGPGGPGRRRGGNVVLSVGGGLGGRGGGLVWWCGWELDAREKAAIRLVPEQAWQIAVDHRGEVRERRADDACPEAGRGHRACWIEEAHVTELTGLLREGPDGDQLKDWPTSMPTFA